MRVQLRADAPARCALCHESCDEACESCGATVHAACRKEFDLACVCGERPEPPTKAFPSIWWELVNAEPGAFPMVDGRVGDRVYDQGRARTFHIPRRFVRYDRSPLLGFDYGIGYCEPARTLSVRVYTGLCDRIRSTMRRLMDELHEEREALNRRGRDKAEELKQATLFILSSIWPVVASIYAMVAHESLAVRQGSALTLFFSLHLFAWLSMRALRKHWDGLEIEEHKREVDKKFDLVFADFCDFEQDLDTLERVP